MDKKSKMFLWVFSALIFGSVLISFYRYVLLKDYQIFAHIDCIPTKEACFVWKCDPKAAQDDENACSGNLSQDMRFYKKIQKNAGSIPLCEEGAPGCPPLSCIQNERNCTVTYCNEDTLEEGEACSSPEDIQLFSEQQDQHEKTVNENIVPSENNLEK